MSSDEPQYKVKQTSHFKRGVKKLSKADKAALDKAVKAVAADPEIGEQKSGDLSNVWVYKFRLTNYQALLGYTFDEGALVLTLLAIGSHENYYRDL